jgi:hypothetical protein
VIHPSLALQWKLSGQVYLLNWKPDAKAKKGEKMKKQTNKKFGPWELLLVLFELGDIFRIL